MGKIIKSEKKKLRDKIINFKVNEDDYVKIKREAKKYFNGNISGWIRYASVNHKPRPNQLTDY